MTGEPILSVEDLTVEFDTPTGPLLAIEDLSFDLHRGETVCLVGESGSGKTVAGETLTRLIPTPPGRVTAGAVRFDDQDLTTASEKTLRSIRGDRIAHVFQNPQGALDPAYTIGDQVAETIELHEDDPAAHERAVDLLDRVGLPRPATAARKYPHELSGGVKQRVVIAAALAANPDVLVADEPTTALDVVTQAQILRLLADLQAERDLAVLFITHDLGVVSQVADRVVVVYAGRVMERGPVGPVLSEPAHPYTRALLGSLPGRSEAMRPLEGSLPDPLDKPSGCLFHPRCPDAVEACSESVPPEHALDSDRSAACVYHGPGFDAADLGTGSTDGDSRERHDTGGPQRRSGTGEPRGRRGDAETRSGSGSGGGQPRGGADE